MCADCFGAFVHRAVRVLDMTPVTGVPNGKSVVDNCGVCGGDSSSCAGCDGVPGSNAVLVVVCLLDAFYRNLTQFFQVRRVRSLCRLQRHVRAHSNYHGFGVWVGHQRSAFGIWGFLRDTYGLVISNNVAEVVKA